LETELWLARYSCRCLLYESSFFRLALLIGLSLFGFLVTFVSHALTMAAARFAVGGSTRLFETGALLTLRHCLIRDISFLRLALLIGRCRVLGLAQLLFPDYLAHLVHCLLVLLY
jgi:hypothetical protein